MLIDVLLLQLTRDASAYANAAKDMLKDASLSRFVSFVPPPERVMKGMSERAAERETVRSGKDEYFPVVEVPLPSELPANAEAAASAEQGDITKRAAGHRR